MTGKKATPAPPPLPAELAGAVDKDPELARKLADLTPDQIEMFISALTLAMRKRRVLLVGYVATATALILGLVWALYIYGKTLGSGQFMAWVFLVPLFVAAVILLLFGRIARSLREK